MSVGSLTPLFYRIVFNFIVFSLRVCMRVYVNFFLAWWDGFFEFVVIFSLFSQWSQRSSRLSQFGIGFRCIFPVYVFSRHCNKCKFLYFAYLGFGSYRCKFLYFVYLGFGSYRFQFSLCCNCCYSYPISVLTTLLMTRHWSVSKDLNCACILKLLVGFLPYLAVSTSTNIV